MIFRSLLGHNNKRRRLLRNAAAPLKAFYQTPFPDLKTPLAELDIIALDLETTGLDASRDHIVSVGLVAVRSLAIQLGSADHQIMFTQKDLPEDTTILHGITDDAVANGEGIQRYFPKLLELLAGKVLLVHHAALEKAFLNALCKNLYGQVFYMPVIDTEVLAKRLLTRRSEGIKSGQLRLYNLRQQYSLPDYGAHNALNDALATAELFLALFAEISPKLNGKLQDVLTD